MNYTFLIIFEMNANPRFCVLLMSAGTEMADNSGNRKWEIIFKVYTFLFIFYFNKI